MIDFEYGKSAAQVAEQLQELHQHVKKLRRILHRYEASMAGQINVGSQVTIADHVQPAYMAGATGVVKNKSERWAVVQFPLDRNGRLSNGNKWRRYFNRQELPDGTYIASQWFPVSAIQPPLEQALRRIEP